MKRPQVLFITTWYPTQSNPLSGTFVREHARAAQIYADVTVLHAAGCATGFGGLWHMETDTDHRQSAGIPVHRVWNRCVLNRDLSYPIQILAIAQGFRHIARGSFRPDVLHAHHYAAGLAAVLISRHCSIPVVITEHSTAFPRQALRWPQPSVAAAAFGHADKVLPVSHSLQRAIEAYNIDADFHPIPNVVDTSLFHPGPMPNSGLPSSRKHLLVVSLLDVSPKKGIQYLLPALARLKKEREDWQLDLVGDGPAMGKYRQMASELGIADKITFHGLKAKEEVAEFMRRADLLIIPSLFETFSVVTAEALVTGLPVLATRCGGPEEFVTEECGILVQPGDVSALHSALGYMLDNLGQYSRRLISEHAVQRFSPDCVGAQLLSVYLSVSRDSSGMHT